MPFEVDVSVDPPKPDETVGADLRLALVDAVNLIAEGARLTVTEALPVYLDRPTPFIRSGIGVRKARSGTRDIEAEVDVLPKQARVLRYQILGGVRVAGDVATTKLGPLVPGPDAPRNAYGNLPRGYIRRVLQQPGVAWVRLRPGQLPALVRRRGSGKLQILALIIREAHYKPRLPFYDLVEEAVARSGVRVATNRIEALQD